MTALTDRPATNGQVAAVDVPHPTRGVDNLASTPERPPVDRLGAVWKGKWWILLAALLAAGLTFSATLLVPKTFSSSIQVGLNASPVTGSSVADLAVASNNLAAQYAQVVSSEAVLQPAAVSSKTTSADLGKRTTATTLASQNIVSITVQAAEPAQAQAEANALGASLVDYITQQGQLASKQYSETVVTQLKPLSVQIDNARKRVDKATAILSKANKKTAPQTISAASAQLGSAQSLLTVLTDRRASLVTQSTLQAISLAPRSQVLGGASAVQQVEPRPALYTLIAGILGLVIGTQLVVTVADRRQRRGGRFSV